MLKKRKTSWNKGLKKETDKRIVKIAIKSTLLQRLTKLGWAGGDA